MATTTLNGVRREGRITINGQIPASAGGGAVDSVFGRVGVVVAATSDYDASQVDNDSTVTGATVKDALETLESNSVGGTNIRATGSAAFVLNVWQTVYTLPLAEGEFYSVAVHNSVFQRGLAADVRNTQFRYYAVIRRQTGGVALTTIGAVGAQGNTTGSFRTLAVGNNIEFQAQFAVSDTYNYILPINLEGGII